LAVRRTSPICAVAALLFFAGPANAAELCVKCTGPDANYACIVNGATTASTADAAIKLYCITALAKAGPHASCAIDRDNKPPCQGERRELPVPDALEHVLDVQSGSQSATPPSAPVTTGVPTAVQPLPANAAAQQQPAQPENAPPKTVQEMVEKGAQSAGAGISETGKSAGEAAQSTGTALQKAGSAVAKAAKNSWECLSSFFSKC
jgi:hypothetical protein